MFNLFVIFGLLLMSYGIFKFFNRNKKSVSDELFLSNEELDPFLKNINLQREEKIRKAWLFSFWIVLTFPIFIIVFNIAQPDGFEKSFGGNSSPLLSILALLIFLLPFYLSCWMTYYCSYKKKGTALILLRLFTMPFLLLTELEIVAMGTESSSFMLISLISTIIYWVSCLCLLRVNAAREYQMVLAFKAKYGPDANGFCS